MIRKFPEGFLWGTSTSAFQVETPFDHDFKGHVTPDGSILEKTIDHERHFEEDAALIAFLGNAYRGSLAWDRLQREPRGQLETKTIDEYRRFFGALKDKGVKIMLVLHHFANPSWFAAKGGWTVKESAYVFEDYAAKVISELGDLITLWNTINEPTVYATSAYMFGLFPPYAKNPLQAMRVIENLSVAHSLAYETIKSKRPDHEVGISNNTMVFEGVDPLGEVLARAAKRFYLNYVPDKFSKVDYIGVSYYGKVYLMPLPAIGPEGIEKLDKIGYEHDMMYGIYPQGLGTILRHFSARNPRLPIIITENGFCTHNDEERIKWTQQHLIELHKAIEMGLDVKGYFHWSTFDNWELAWGLKYPFGLVHINPKTMERTMKASGRFYSKIARTGSIENL